MLGLPLPENMKVTKCSSHVFDRYEIHIQDFVDFIYAFVHNFPILLLVRYIMTMRYSSFQKHKTTNGTHDFHFSNLLNPRFTQIIFLNIFQGLSCFCLGVLVTPKKRMLVLGLGDGLKDQEIMNMKFSGL